MDFCDFTAKMTYKIDVMSKVNRNRASPIKLAPRRNVEIAVRFVEPTSRIALVPIISTLLPIKSKLPSALISISLLVLTVILDCEFKVINPSERT